MKKVKTDVFTFHDAGLNAFSELLDEIFKDESDEEKKKLIRHHDAETFAVVYVLDYLERCLFIDCVGIYDNEDEVSLENSFTRDCFSECAKNGLKRLTDSAFELFEDKSNSEKPLFLGDFLFLVMWAVKLTEYLFDTPHDSIVWIETADITND